MRLILLTVSFALACCFTSRAEAIGIGEAAPDFEFDQTWNAPAGKTRLSDYRGSVVLLECWATWCGPCKQIIPHMRELNSVYMPQGLNIISVSDERASTIEPFIRRNNMDYPVARAEGVLRMYGRSTIPSAWLINAAGAVIWEGHPAEIDSRLMRSALNADATAPTSGAAGQGGESNWWLWLIVVAGLVFAAAVGWFLYSTRDKMPKTLQTSWYQPPPQPQAQGPPPGQYGAPPQPQYGAPQQPQYGAPPQQQYGAPPQPPAPGYGAPPQPQSGYLNAGGPPPQTLGYNAPPPRPPQGYGQQAGVGGNNAYGGTPTHTGNTEFLTPKKDAPFLGGQPNPDDEQFPPFDTNQNRPGNR